MEEKVAQKVEANAFVALAEVLDVEEDDGVPNELGKEVDGALEGVRK